MTPQNKNLLICAEILGVVLTIYLLNKRDNLALSQQVNTPDRGDNFPLLMGSVGERVLQLQKAVNIKLVAGGSKPIAVDGIWGPETQAAVTKIVGSSSVTEASFNANIK